MELTDQQWEQIRRYLPKQEPRPKGGRPRVADRPIMEGILWILRSGARWKDLPKEFPAYQTCHRRFQEWVALGCFQKALRGLGRSLVLSGAIDRSELFIDGSFSSAKKGHMRGKDQTRKGHENHGHFRRKRPASRG